MLRPLRLLAAVSALLIAGAIGTDRAWATHTTTGECLYNESDYSLNLDHIYRYGNPNTKGTTNKVLFRDRTTGSCVPPHVTQSRDRSYAWSAALVRLEFTTNNDLVAVGWHKYFEQDEERHRAYTEWIRDGVLLGNHCCFLPAPDTCMNHNESDVWRVSWVGSTSWGLYINCIDGVGYRHLITYSGTGFNNGTVLGETGRFDHTDVHMVDQQIDLSFKNSQGSWVLWNDNNCLVDDAFQWRAWKTNTHAYAVDWGTETC